RQPKSRWQRLNRSGRCCVGALELGQLPRQCGAQTSCGAGATNQLKSSAWSHHSLRHVARSRPSRPTVRAQRRCWFHGKVSCSAFSFAPLGLTATEVANPGPTRGAPNMESNETPMAQREQIPESKETSKHNETNAHNRA